MIFEASEIATIMNETVAGKTMDETMQVDVSQFKVIDKSKSISN